MVLPKSAVSFEYPDQMSMLRRPRRPVIASWSVYDPFSGEAVAVMALALASVPRLPSRCPPSCDGISSSVRQYHALGKALDILLLSLASFTWT